MDQIIIAIICSIIFVILMIMFWPRLFGGAEWNPARMKVVRRMLIMAKTSKKDVVYDLGCGDGRFVKTAVKEFNAKKAVGIEIDPSRYLFSKFRIRKLKNAKIEFGSFFKKNLNKATIITCFLQKNTNNNLRDKFSKLKKGTKIVSHVWKFKDWNPVQIDKKLKIYLYVIGKT